MKLGKFLLNRDTDYLLRLIFGSEEPVMLLDIARTAGQQLGFPLFQASIGQGIQPIQTDSRWLRSSHMLTWFRQPETGTEKTIIGDGLGNPLSHYYLGLWYAYGWKKPERHMNALLADLGRIGQIQLEKNWAWVVIDPRTTFSLGAFYAVFGKQASQ
jgi:hypothetical protein